MSSLVHFGVAFGFRCFRYFLESDHKPRGDMKSIWSNQNVVSSKADRTSRKVGKNIKVVSLNIHGLTQPANMAELLVEAKLGQDGLLERFGGFLFKCLLLIFLIILG